MKNLLQIVDRLIYWENTAIQLGAINWHKIVNSIYDGKKKLWVKYYEKPNVNTYTKV